MFELFALRCDICSNILRKSRHRWKIHGKRLLVCPACNAKLERQQSKVAFDPTAQFVIPNVRGRSTGVGGCVIVFVCGSILASLFLPKTKTGTSAQNSDAPLPGPASPAISTSPSSNPGPSGWSGTVAEAQREAVRRNPQLGVRGSTLNTEFIARYRLYQQQNPDFFRDHSWPLKLAEELNPEPPPK